jgi:hypothetical protein
MEHPHESSRREMGNKPAADLAQAIGSAIQVWWETESADWDLAVTSDNLAESDTDLWDDLPAVDSKTIARTSPIFERHLGIPLDVKLIRRGGYGSIQEAIDDLVPKMMAAASDQDNQS